MSDPKSIDNISGSYQDAKQQLDQIVVQVRKSDVSLERSLDLLEEGVALANRCTELIDQASWTEAEDFISGAEADADSANDSDSSSENPDESLVNDKSDDSATRNFSQDDTEAEKDLESADAIRAVGIEELSDNATLDAESS